MRKLLFCLFLLTIVFVSAQNDNCSEATSLNVGTSFSSSVVTSSNLGATTDGELPSCASDAVDNVWFTAVVPQSGKITIETRKIDNSAFDDSVLTVYSGTCGSLSQVSCNDDNYSNENSLSKIQLTGQTPGAILYISVWKYNSEIDNGDFQISAYEPFPPTNDNCSEAKSLTVGVDFSTGATTVDNTGATTDGPTPSCAPNALNNIWFTAVVPQSGNLKVTTLSTSNSSLYGITLTAYNGTCDSLTEIDCNTNANSTITLIGQTPGSVIYISASKEDSYIDDREFQISAYDPIPPANDDCSNAKPLTVGTDFDSGAITTNNFEATSDGTPPSCNPYSINNIWFTAVIPQSGQLKIVTKNIPESLFHSPTISAYTGTCDSLIEIGCSVDYDYSSILLTDQVPGTTIYISVWKKDQDIEDGKFQISTYDPIPPINDNCSQATLLTVGPDFDSNVITSTNAEASTDGTLPSCNSEAKDNVWFKVIVPASGNLTIETNDAPDSPFYDPIITVYNGDCTSLTEIECKQGFDPSVFLTSQTPGTALYISVWKHNPYSHNGNFLISAYDDSILSTHETSKNGKEITAFPNPFNDILTISDISNVNSIFITDTAGRMVKTIDKPTASLYLNDLKEGLYFVTLTMKDGSKKTIKAIKK
ncbi:hypothetical protein BBI01_15680 [Chryseobacterium artocarpi]|uniref:Uncharacterized protein n=1 Tax=Chryseobacterium artocarpi TaxID=1414727 RepID=A0A1B8ZD69_9FLAO|nr:T9SS type A sorting domain-containing protein [Chryseobacterium artocarpi]OCA69572.1 hypothetical protein BBI01_15680 [Chryseobacterium artocarpi]